MSAAVKGPSPAVPALAVSVALHGLLLALPLAVGLHRGPSERPLPQSVAFSGSSLEVEAPTRELSSPALPGPVVEVPVETEPAAAARAGPEPHPTPAHDVASEPAPREAPAAFEPPARPRAGATARGVPARPPSPAGASAPSAPSAGPSAPGSFGAEGLPPGVRRLGYAFTRAIPVATPADPAWKELPAGPVGTLRLVLTVDAESRVAAVQVLPPRIGEPPLPEPLRRMAERTTLLLRAGQFALSASNQPGKELLTVSVVLRDEPPEEDAAGVVVQKKFVGAQPGQPGSAYFRYDTGRAFEARVTTSAAPN